MLSRRQAIIGLAAIAAGGGTAHVMTRPDTGRIARVLLELLPDRRSAAWIGAAWQQRHPEIWLPRRDLPLRLADRLRDYGWDPDAAHDGKLARRAARLIHDAFVYGDTEDILGWRITSFQAELCGLAYAWQAT